MGKIHTECEHYFSSKPASASRPQLITAVLRGKKFRFHTDKGVFAKDFVDFGTRRLIEVMRLPEEGNILDWGCGYGVIGVVAAALCPQAKVWMIDVNERAAKLAQLNLLENGIANATVICGNGFEALPQDVNFNAILTNPPIHAGKAVVLSLIKEANQRLCKGGEFWLVGRTKQGAKTLQKIIAELFGSVDVVDRKGGYRVLRAVKLKTV